MGHTTGPLDLAAAVLPGADLGRAVVVQGEFHDVVLLPGEAVVKIARRAATPHLERRAALHAALAAAGLPFAVPRPLGPVCHLGERAAVALSWVDGAPAPPDPPTRCGCVTCWTRSRPSTWPPSAGCSTSRTRTPGGTAGRS